MSTFPSMLGGIRTTLARTSLFFAQPRCTPGKLSLSSRSRHLARRGPTVIASSQKHFATMAPVTRLTDQLEKPELDDRSYRVIKLPNELEALLVHDPETDKASASVNVKVGAFSDPEDMPGMAHAVEHLLFMGTEKFPTENAYSQYLTSHSGHANAYTAATETNYYFEVAASAESSSDTTSSPEVNGVVNGTATSSSETEKSPLYGALERFAPFFICPLFLEDTLDRELRAVDSENKKNLQSDQWRFAQLDKSLSNPNHPYHHFSTGNLQTLRDEPRSRGVEIRKEFMRFHDKHYSANRMKLVVLGKESLDTLEGWVADLFADVKNKNLAPNRWDDAQPYASENLLTQIFAKPVMDNRSLDIFWLYRDEEHLYKSHPSRYLSHLIGHEGPGSILAYIKAKGWGNTLSAGAATICHGAGVFEISIRLTKDGLANYKEIVKTVFQYIALLKESKIEKWIFDETKGMGEVDFRFKQKTPASSFTHKLSSVMQKPLPREWLLSGQRLLREFQPDAIAEGLSYLRDDNYRLTLVSQEYPGDWDKREKWYGTQYRSEKIPDAFQAEIRQAIKSTAAERPKELHLPHRNEFIPTQLTVEKRDVAEPAKTPRLIRNDNGVRIWWKKDDQFWVPKASLKATFRSPLVMITPENVVKANLYCWLVKDALDEYSYDAEIAGLQYDLYHSSLGLCIDVHGYNDKMPVLLEKVLHSMRHLEIKPDRFQIVKERLLRGHRNHEFMAPYQQIGEYTRWLGTERSWINEDLLAEVPHLTVEDITTFYPQLLNQTHIEILAHGNLHKEEALRMSQLLETTLKPRPLPRAQWPMRRTLILPEGANFTYRRPLADPANVNSSIEYYLQVDTAADPLLRAQTSLLAQLGEEKAFNQLRTREQLGYVVHTSARPATTGIGYRVIIQSERSPEYLEGRINAFLVQLGESIRSMPAAEFEGHRRSLVSKRLERLKNLDEELARFWGHIASEYFVFRQAEQDAERLRGISQADMAAFFDRYIDPRSPRRAKLAVHLVSQAAPSAAAPWLSTPDQREKVLALLVKHLNAAGVGADREALERRFADVALAGGASRATLLRALEAYLLTDADLPAKPAAALAERTGQLMDTALPGLGVELRPPTPPPPAKGGGDANGGELPPAPEMPPATLITDPTAFKAGLLAGPAPRPKEELSTFEDLEPKL